MKPNERVLPLRRTDELQKGRVSIPGARYFVTFITQYREPWLRAIQSAGAVLSVLRAWHEEQDGAIHAVTVMPDHVHVVFTLGARLSAGQCVGRWKSGVRRAGAFQHEWLRDFFEHRLRTEEALEDYALYIFLNPYRAGLVGANKTWPWWWAPEPQLFRFSENLNPDGTPPQEWLGWPDERFKHISVGE